MEVKIPTVGESISEVVVGKWLKNDGDRVEVDEAICELESDKATFELTAEQAGILRIKAKEGDTLTIGAIVAEIEPGESKTPDKPEKKADEEEFVTPKTESESELKKTGRMVEMKVPKVGESITEVTIARWEKKEGDFVELDEVIAEIESDKATFELTAEAQGILHTKVNEGDTLDIGAVICVIEAVEGVPIKEKQSQPEGKSPSVNADKEAKPAYAAGHPSPASAKILKEKGISPTEVQGTGVEGRITKEDALKAGKKSPESGKSEEKEVEAQQSLQVARGQRRERMTTLRKTIAKRLVSVKNEMAMLTTFNEVDMKPVMDLRSKYKEKFKEKYEVNLGFMSFFVKASCQALREWPAVNAMIDRDEIVYNDFCDISVAVSTPKGLVAPVIRNADLIPFDQVEKEIIRLATRARDGKISIEEMRGGTFTITNGGVFGSMLSTPIINAPQAAILGMHNIVERPVAINGEIAIRPVMYIALSYDHRLIDGREAVSFLVRIKELIEDPGRLLLAI